MSNIYIKSVSEFIKQISETDNDSLKLRTVYRGQSNMKKPLLPSLFRKPFSDLDCRYSGENKFKHFENWLLDEFKKQGYPYIDSSFGENKLMLTILAQHHGLPTKLLDWSENPLVSLFFATENKGENTDSIVYELKLNSYTHNIKDYNKNTIPDVISIIYPPLIDKRVEKQASCFTIHKLPDNEGLILDIEEQIKKDKLEYELNKFIIKNEFREPIKNQLNKLGINHYTIFPDLEGLSNKLKYEIANKEIIGDSDFSFLIEH